MTSDPELINKYKQQALGINTIQQTSFSSMSVNNTELKGGTNLVSKQTKITRSKPNIVNKLSYDDDIVILSLSYDKEYLFVSSFKESKKIYTAPDLPYNTTSTGIRGASIINYGSDQWLVTGYLNPICLPSTAIVDYIHCFSIDSSGVEEFFNINIPKDVYHTFAGGFTSNLYNSQGKILIYLLNATGARNLLVYVDMIPNTPVIQMYPLANDNSPTIINTVDYGSISLPKQYSTFTFLNDDSYIIVVDATAVTIYTNSILTHRTLDNPNQRADFRQLIRDVGYSVGAYVTTDKFIYNITSIELDDLIYSFKPEETVELDISIDLNDFSNQIVDVSIFK